MSERNESLRERRRAGSAEDRTTIAHATAADALLAEYAELKAEQRSRIVVRDNQVYLMLASSGAVLAFGFSSETAAFPAIGLPFLGLILGWGYVAADLKVSAIGEYMRRVIGPGLHRLQRGADAREPLGWERRHGEDRGYSVRKILQLCHDVLVFSVAPWGVGLTVMLTGAPSSREWVAFAGGTVVALLCAANLTRTDRERKVSVD